ncbi:MAG: hypothetical protein BGO69_02280 [Bacteroidetes bacterium 46-16]|nr:MAG: hypothetical protein BGO69_02280 [Bacteroidetes bacterium 46-16]
MAEKILYYIGAGASANALPLARNVTKYDATGFPVGEKSGLIRELRQYLEDDKIVNIEEDESVRIIEKLKEESKNLAIAAEKFGDVDTYAKLLHLTDKSGKMLQGLKQTISRFFAIKQLFLNAHDDRYLSWLVNIMYRNTFPENVKVLSWNYDFQIELAHRYFGQGEDIKRSKSGFIYSPSLLNYYPNLDPTFRDFDTLSLIHLNGVAGFAKNDDQYLNSIFQPENVVTREAAISFLANSNLYELLHFAWENSGYHNQLMQYAKKMIVGTTIIVVVGYSFPFFNREVDKEIFKALLDGSQLRKIYYQDPVLDGQQLRAQFGFDKGIEIVHVKQTDSFHVPFEY